MTTSPLDPDFGDPEFQGAALSDVDLGEESGAAPGLDPDELTEPPPAPNEASDDGVDTGGTDTQLAAGKD